MDQSEPTHYPREALRADDSSPSPVEGLRGYSYVVLKVLQGRRERNGRKGKSERRGASFKDESRLEIALEAAQMS